MQELELPPWGPVPPNHNHASYLNQNTAMSLNVSYNPLKTSRMLVLTGDALNCTGSIEGLQSPKASMWTEARRARGPCAAAATSALGYGSPPTVFCNIFEAVPCSANAYWSKISKLVFIRHASLCSCIAAVIAWSRDKVSHHWPWLISKSQADSGAPSHSRKRGWFNGTPRPPSGGAWSSTLYVVCL